MIAIALLLFAAAAISPSYVPWPRVGLGLHAHRSDLALLAFGVAGIAFALYSVTLLGS